jgi:hypothetical protein
MTRTWMTVLKVRSPECLSPWTSRAKKTQEEICLRFVKVHDD